jgi:hypothetical protein
MLEERSREADLFMITFLLRETKAASAPSRSCGLAPSRSLKGTYLTGLWAVGGSAPKP